MKYLFANWKAHKNLKEAERWVKEFNALLTKDKKIKGRLENNDLKIIICPSHQLLYPVKQWLIKMPNLSLGAQDISYFDKGSYTGEVPAQNLAGLVQYAIIGHSERRKYFKENNAIIDQKLILAKDYDIEPILCVRNGQDIIPEKVNFIAYEPVQSIGTGENESLKEILKVKEALHLDKNTMFLYGGSASGDNATGYLQSGQINGFLIGTASRKAADFYNAIAASL